MKEEKPATPDILWKELIRTFYRDFVAFFKPELLTAKELLKTIILFRIIMKLSMSADVLFLVHHFFSNILIIK